jgi:hypothetical protein
MSGLQRLVLLQVLVLLVRLVLLVLCQDHRSGTGDTRALRGPSVRVADNLNHFCKLRLTPMLQFPGAEMCTVSDGGTAAPLSLN